MSYESMSSRKWAGGNRVDVGGVKWTVEGRINGEYALEFEGIQRWLSSNVCEMVDAAHILNIGGAVVVNNYKGGYPGARVLLSDGRAWSGVSCLTINVGDSPSVCTGDENPCIHSRIAKDSDARAVEAEKNADGWAKFSSQTLGAIVELNSVISRLARLVDERVTKTAGGE